MTDTRIAMWTDGQIGSVHMHGCICGAFRVGREFTCPRRRALNLDGLVPGQQSPPLLSSNAIVISRITNVVSSRSGLRFARWICRVPQNIYGLFLIWFLDGFCDCVLKEVVNIMCSFVIEWKLKVYDN